jgi:uncharacterized protein (DUF433 family)
VGDDRLAIANFSDRFDRTMTADSVITRDPKILNGTAVFKGTRVPVKTLFDYLSDGFSFEYFLETFPSVTRQLAEEALRLQSTK